MRKETRKAAFETAVNICGMSLEALESFTVVYF
jgi:hypothetical protein